ncbi:MAG: SMI1/KNR4 family protein [bacterium]|nr:SMI1/KNR4 family protein [bacterium]
MLRRRNGFFAFEGALHVLPAGGQPAVMTLEEWNSSHLWRHEYADLADGLFFFAEDAFGNQFCLREDRVCLFDAETGQAEVIGSSIKEWANQVLSNYEFLTGFPLFHEWQVVHGRVPAGSRLVPLVPFVLGGEYSLSNLRVAGAVSGMRARGNLARQIRDLPDGAQIEFKVVD